MTPGAGDGQKRFSSVSFCDGHGPGHHGFCGEVGAELGEMWAMLSVSLRKGDGDGAPRPADDSFAERLPMGAAAEEEPFCR